MKIKFNRGEQKELQSMLALMGHGISVIALPVRDEDFFRKRLEEGYTKAAFGMVTPGTWVDGVHVVGCWIFSGHQGGKHFLYERFVARRGKREVPTSVQRECTQEWLAAHYKTFGIELHEMGTIAQVFEVFESASRGGIFASFKKAFPKS